VAWYILDVPDDEYDTIWHQTFEIIEHECPPVSISTLNKLHREALVLLPGNQMQTQVTPLVAGICKPYFDGERLKVLGREQEVIPQVLRYTDNPQRLFDLAQEARGLKTAPARQFKKFKVKISALFLTEAYILQAGDFVLIAWGSDESNPRIKIQELPSRLDECKNKAVSDFFW
jgi:hypothetical protein